MAILHNGMKTYEYNGGYLTVKQILKLSECHITENQLRYLIGRGIPITNALKWKSRGRRDVFLCRAKVDKTKCIKEGKIYKYLIECPGCKEWRYAPSTSLCRKEYQGLCPKCHAENNKDVRGQNLTGAIVGSWKVLKFDYEANHRKWLCECNNCGWQSHKSKKELDKKCFTCKGLLRGEAGFNKLLHNYKSSAKQRNYDFMLTNDQFKNLTSDSCFYCGVEPTQQIATDNKIEWGTYLYNGIDRVDNTIGYVESNCVSCCWLCNQAKYNMSQNDFITWIKRLITYQVRKTP